MTTAAIYATFTLYECATTAAVILTAHALGKRPA